VIFNYKISRANAQTPDVFSVSGDLSHREDVFKMAKFMEDQLKALGVETRLEDLGTASFDGQDIKLPPAVLGKIGEDPNKKTLLIYGHFDVQPVSILVAGRVPH
jgi:Cys-Gly metallodipeptidase DUG1